MTDQDEWRRIGDVDWLCVEPTPTSTSEGPADRTDDIAQAGLILGHGYAHEAVANSGLGVAAVTALARELARPRETEHGVTGVQTVARTFVQDSIVQLTGRPDEVRHGLGRLDALLRDPSEIDLTDLPVLPEPGWHGWSHELTAWWGFGPVAWAAEATPIWSGDPRSVRELLSWLHPSRTPGAVGWVTDPSVLPAGWGPSTGSGRVGGEGSGRVGGEGSGRVGGASLRAGVTRAEVLEAPGVGPSTGSGRVGGEGSGRVGGDGLARGGGDTSARRGRPLRWREPSPVADGPGSVVAGFGNNLLSGRMATSAVDFVALRLLVQTLHRDLVRFRQLPISFQTEVEQIDADALFGIRAVPEGRDYDGETVRNAFAAALQTFAALNESVLAQEVQHSRQAEALNAELTPATRAVDAYRSGLRPGFAEIVGRYDALTTDELRQACVRLLDHSLLGVADGESASPFRPLWRVPELPKPQRPRIARRAMVPLAIPGAPRGVSWLRASGRVLEIVTKPPNYKGAVRTFAPVRQAVDLSSVAVRIDRGTAFTTLIDTDNRRAAIIWPAFLRRSALRSLVDAAAPPPVRVTAPMTEELTNDLHRRIRLARIGAAIFAVVAVGLALLVFFHPVTGQNRAADQPLTGKASVGTAVTLANGTAITVSNPTWHAIENGNRQELDLTAELCGGRLSGSDNTRNLVRPDDFGLAGLAPASRTVNPSGSGGTPLAATELARGQCVHGLIGFAVDTTAPVPGGTVTYRNAAGDGIDWSL